MESIIATYFNRYWWVILILALVFLVRFFGWFIVRKWKRYINKKYEDSIKFVVLDIQIPEALEKTPATMEQFFSVLHGTYATFNFRQTWVEGMKNDWFSFEIVSFGGDIHFYIRASNDNRALVESQLYAHFPEIEIQEVEDWIKKIPFKDNNPTPEYDYWSEEFMLTKPDCYPIRTYIDFELKQGVKAELAVDPIANLLELMGHIDSHEVAVYQILITPESDWWREQGKDVIDEMMGRKQKEKKAGLVAWVSEFFSHLGFLIGGGEPPVSPKVEDKKDERAQFSLMYLSPGEQEMVHAIERNISKVGFYTVMRLLYYAPRQTFDGGNKITALASCFEQYTSQNLNSLTTNPKLTGWVKWFPQDIFNVGNFYLTLKYRKPLPLNYSSVKLLRKKEILRALKKRKFGKRERGHKGFIFNTEELATVFHFPMKSVATPELPRVTARKGGAPQGLPVT